MGANSSMNDSVRTASPSFSDLSLPVLSAGIMEKGSYEHMDLEEGSDTPLLLQNYKPTKLDIYLLGITIVIGGQYFSWNAGLSAGLDSYTIAFVLMGTAYIIFCCCLSEITGALPFAGGSYGLSRCTLGFYPAFLIGCCEALAYVVYVSSAVISFGNMIADIIPAVASVKPLIWLAFYVSATCFHVRGDRIFWVFNSVLAVVSIGILLLYCFGSVSYTDFKKNALDDKLATFAAGGGFSGFMKALPLAAWFFVGIEALNFASDEVAKPTATIPKAQVGCVITLFVTGAMVFFVTVSLPPGVTALVHEQVPFNRGFTLMFNMTKSTADILSLPATYATAFGFMWGYGKLIAAMGSSRLLPAFLAKTSRYGTSPNAIICGSAVSFLICVVVHYASIENYTYITCITCAFLTYVGQCVGYISLRRNYRNITISSFRSPFGIAGAIYSMLVWLLSLVSAVAFQGNGGVEILTILGIVLVLTIYYFAYARKQQTFSAQEKRVLLVARDVL